MWGVIGPRIAELSRPDYARDLAEYARLEYPREDVRTVRLQAIEAARDRTPPGPWWLRLRQIGRAGRVSTPAKS
jgi:hypothetical protein